MPNGEVVPREPSPISINQEEIEYIKKALASVREEVMDNPYLEEARRVLTVQGYRSAIGSYWNAVVDDLRKKMVHRSLDLFNKEMQKNVQTYEDFQRDVTDYELIEGAYRIGVIDWEAKRMLHQARETRNIFDGHPSSSAPSVIKVIDLMIDCNKYVLSRECPPAIVNIDDYIATMDSPDYLREEIAIEQTLGDLPEIYRTELANRFFDIYKHEATSTTLRSNIEFCAPILWRFLPKETKHQIGKRVDQVLISGNQKAFEAAFRFLVLVDNSLRYTARATRMVVFGREIELLESNLDTWEMEGAICARLERLGTSIPEELLDRYVAAFTQTYVGYESGRSYYSWSGSPIVRRLFERFDERAADAFVKCVKTSESLRRRIGSRPQLDRLRTLGNILLERANPKGATKELLMLLVDDSRTNDFFRVIGPA